MTTKFKTVQSKFNVHSANKRRIQTMSQSGTIVHRKANTMIPNAYLEKVLKENPHGWGAAIVDEDNGSKYLMLNSDIEGAKLEDIQASMKEFMDKDITFYFCNSSSALSLADLSPHILIAEKDGKEEIPKLVAFIEGNFPGFVREKSSHPAEYHLVAEMLGPKFEGLYEMVDQDLDKLTEQLKKPHFKKELLLTSVSRGTITLIAANGAVITFDQNDLSAEYPWGWVSNTHGYVTEGKEAPKVEKKKGLFTRSTVREAAPSSKIAEAVKPVATEAAIIKNFSLKNDRPPGHLSRSERKDWYKSKIGYVPPGWEKNVAVNTYLDPEGKVATFAQMNKALGLAAAGLIKQAANPPRVQGKDTAPDTVKVQSDDTPAPVSEQVTAEVLPIMSPDSRKFVQEYLKTAKAQKIIAENADIVMDPTKVQGLEAKFADFAAQLGLKSMDEFIQWDYEMFLHVGKNRPEALAILCNTFRNIVAKSRMKEVRKEEAEVVASVSEKKPGLFSRKAAA